MTETILTRERILEAAEDVLRRYGPSKATVVDVARALGVSHGSVYRHFESKTALREAVAGHWLERICAPLEAIAGQEGAAGERLRRWFDALIYAKRSRALDDPELFATYLLLAEESRHVVQAHLDSMTNQVAAILEAGRRQGELKTTDPTTTARALLDATARFHHPAHAAQWSDTNTEAAFEAVWEILMQGLMV